MRADFGHLITADRSPRTTALGVTKLEGADEMGSDVPWSRRISGRKTLKSRIAFMASSDEDDCIKSREFMIFFPEYPGNLLRSQIGTKIVS